MRIVSAAILVCMMVEGCQKPAIPRSPGSAKQLTEDRSLQPAERPALPANQAPPSDNLAADMEFLPEDNAVYEPEDIRGVDPIPEDDLAAIVMAETQGTSAESTDAVSMDADWSQLTDLEDLKQEIAVSLERISENLKRSSDFSRNLGAIRAESNLIALNAGVLGQYPKQDGWKHTAVDLQETAMDLTDAASARGARNYAQSKQAYDALQKLVAKAQGQRVSADPADELELYDWTEFREIDAIMKRVDRAFKQVSGTTNRQDSFQRDIAALRHETRVIATLGEVAGRIRGEDGKFRKLASNMTAAAMQALQAIDASDLTGARSAITALDNSCKTCHEEYRFKKKTSF